jgi:putative phosphoesterase
MKIGVISDTHDHLDAKIPKLFEGVDHILHAGDIGLPWVILQLKTIAPVTAVLGNNDAGLNFKETELVEIERVRFLIHHIVDIRCPPPAIQRRLARDNPHVIVFGHTHKPCDERIGNRLFFNPGYAGKPRFAMPRTVAILHCDDGEIRSEFKQL